MSSDNSEQIAEWNGAVGQRWAAQQEQMDRTIRPYGEAALKAAAPRAGEYALDIGCGCGDTSLALARAVGEGGRVLGLDISHPMLEVARARAGAEGLTNVRFDEADAAEADVDGGADLLFSRFGVMFFADPPAAFGRLRRALKDGGRLAFVCWRPPVDNPWAVVPLSAAFAGAGIDPPKSDPHAPGPFAFADADRVRGILAGAGFAEATATPFEHLMHLGPNPREAAENSARQGFAARVTRLAGEDKLPQIIDAIEQALIPLAGPDGKVALPGRAWIFTARAQ